MFTKLICASVLMATSVPVLGHPAGAGGPTIWPYMHSCSVVPDATWFAINTKGTGANSGRSGAVGMPTPWRRIDLQFAVSAPSPGGTIPTVTGFAINTKGTGTSSGRLNSKPTATVTIPISCTGRAVAADPAAQKTALQDISFMGRSAHQSVGWSCAVTGSEEAPQFTLMLLVPVILGVAERATTSKKHSIGGQEDARLESKRQSTGSIGAHQVAIVQHGLNTGGGPRIACSSASREGGGWDVLILS